MPAPRVLIVAGEASGDAHGAGVIRAIRARAPNVRFHGVGGPEMEAAGMSLIGRSDELAVVGLTEVLGHLPAIRRLLNRLRRELRANPPDLFVPIDSPDFNLRLVDTAAKRNVRVVYFVAPQLWAWRAGRARFMRGRVAELLVLFPFEENWFRERGVAATYVGHPRVDEARRHVSSAPAIDALGDSKARTRAAFPPRILLLPGSREGEIRRHLPILARATRLLAEDRPDLRWIVRAAPGIADSAYSELLQSAAVELSREPLLDLAAAATIAVAASGTASFETALMGTPLIVIYRVSPVTWQLARRMVRVPWVSMANLAAGRAIVPEILQNACTPERVAAEVRALLADGDRRAWMRGELLALRDRFGPSGAYGRAAERILHHLASRAATGDEPGRGSRAGEEDDPR